MPPLDSTPNTTSPLAGSNRDTQEIRAEFKRRLLPSLARYTTGETTSILYPLGKTWVVTAASMWAASAIAAPVMLVAGGVIATRFFTTVGPWMHSIRAAAAEVTHDLREGNNNLPAVERWLDKHEDRLPGYIDTLDRVEENLLKTTQLVDAINRRGSDKSVAPEDRKFLAVQGYKKLTPPLPKPSRYMAQGRFQLDNWHHTQLERALRKDIFKKAGDRGHIIRWMLGLTRTQLSALYHRTFG